jgi:FAD:protein FMN transferase
VAASASFRALGTTATLVVDDPGSLAAARELLAEELAGIDRACSRFRSDSELSELNRSAGREVRVSPLLFEAVAVGLRGARLSGGAVDPSLGRALRAIGYDRDFTELAGRTATIGRIRAAAVPGWHAIRIDPASLSVELPPGVELDLGATAKGLAADRAARQINEELGVGVLVNLGGDLSIAGAPPPGGWSVLVTDDHAEPDPRNGQAVGLTGGGLATSSTATRSWTTTRGLRHHIVDPATGDSAPVVWRTASVAAGSCVDANIAATATIVAGAKAPGWLAAHRLPSRLVRSDGQVTRVAGWPEPEPNPAAPGREGEEAAGQ